MTPLSGDVRQFLDQLRSVNPDGVELPIGELRTRSMNVRVPWNEGGYPMQDVRTFVLDVDASPLRCRIYRPQTGERHNAPVMVYFHGGGWTLLGIESHDRLMREYAHSSGWVVIGVDYPLAPESRFPDTIVRCVAGVRKLRHEFARHDLDSNIMVLGGDSAGANIAASVALQLTRAGTPPDGMLLNYGVYDCILTRPSYLEFDGEPYQLTRKKMEWFWDQYCPDETVRLHSLASPMRAELAGLPPTLLVVAGQDVLRDENLEFAERLVTAAVPTTVLRYPEMPHGFLEGCSILIAGREAVMRSAEWLRALQQLPVR